MDTKAEFLRNKVIVLSIAISHKLVTFIENFVFY